MPIIKWAFLCDYASVDPAGKAYIIGTFDHINFAKLPQRWPQLYVALEMQTGGEEQFELSAQITSPTGEETSKRINIPFRSTVNQPRKGFVSFAFFNTEFVEEGEYHIELFLDGTSIHFIPLIIRLKSISNSSNPPLANPL